MKVILAQPRGLCAGVVRAVEIVERALEKHDPRPSDGRRRQQLNRLRETGSEVGVPSYLIADGSELRPEWVANAGVVGITAGASAPEVRVEDVIDALKRLGPVDVSLLPAREEHIEFRPAGRTGRSLET